MSLEGSGKWARKGKVVPIGFTATFFLYFLRVRVDVPGLGKVAGKMLLGGGSAVGKTDVVTIVEFMGASH